MPKSVVIVAVSAATGCDRWASLGPYCFFLFCLTGHLSNSCPISRQPPHCDGMPSHSKKIYTSSVDLGIGKITDEGMFLMSDTKTHNLGVEDFLR